VRPYEEAAEPAGWLDGTDPAGWADAGGEPDPFPPALDAPADPAGPDGRWTDPALVGTGPVPAIDPADDPEAYRADLAAADGDPAAGWDTLLASADPAVRALAARWHGGNPSAR
jgi:hypothetical protein